MEFRGIKIPDENPANRIPRGALIVVAIGLFACLVAAVTTTGPTGGAAAQLEWVQKAPLPDSKAVPVPGGGGTMQLAEAGIRSTGTNINGYALYRTAATLKISAGAPVGGGRIRCAIKAPKGTEVAQTPHLRATYPRSSEELAAQETFETILAELPSHGDTLASLEFEDLFRNGFANEKGIKVEWPTYRIGEERLDYFLPAGPPKQDLLLPFAVVWRTKAIPAAKIACTITTSAGTATARTQGALPKRSEPIAE
ncbi:MAG TPA: hypothetical protein VF731_08540 [Solirubrobacterales bacterium]